MSSFHPHRHARRTSDLVILLMRCRCSNALYTRLIFDDVVLWRSYFRRHMTYLAPSVDACIHQLLERTELQHGRLLVSHAFAYITVSKEGLTEEGTHYRVPRRNPELTHDCVQGGTHGVRARGRPLSRRTGWLTLNITSMLFFTVCRSYISHCVSKCVMSFCLLNDY